MAFQVSPGVQVKEIDLTNVIPAVSTSIAGFVGNYAWGPVGEVTLVSSETDLVKMFGAPKATAAADFMTAAYFLKYGNALKNVRMVTAAAINAADAAATTDVTIGNRDEYDAATILATDGAWIAKYPGTMGNSLRVEVCSDAVSFGSWAYKNQFTAAPGTSDYAAERGGANDEMHVVVLDEDGSFTGTAGSILETFGFVSQGVDAKTNDGASNYYVNVVNNSSKYVWFGNHDVALTTAGNSVVGTTFVQDSTIMAVSFAGGADSAALTASEIQGGFDLLDDALTQDLSLLIMPKFEDTTATIANDLIAIAEGRKDCVAFLSPPTSYSTTSTTKRDDIIGWADLLTSSSYAVVDSTALKVYDKYNDQFVWIPASSSVAGLCAKTDSVADAWFSPAGFNRGQLLGVTKVAYNPNQVDRDELYQSRVNPIVTFPGEGTVLYGDKTAQSKPSAFDRINVRRLFIVLEKAIATAAKYQLFEFNDEFTRAQFRAMVEPFLREVKGRRGLTDFAVICDGTNNTGEVVDTNNFVADIYIKPNRSINFITLNFVATRTGVEFSEVIGK